MVTHKGRDCKDDLKLMQLDNPKVKLNLLNKKIFLINSLILLRTSTLCFCLENCRTDYSYELMSNFAMLGLYERKKE